VVHDIKGENWKLTAGWRKKGLGNLCLRFDPTCSDSTAARYNPLAEIRVGPEEVKDAQNIADMLIDPAGNAPRDHWDLTAHDLLTGVILHVVRAEPDKTLAGCLKFLNPPDRDQEKAVQAMIDTSHGREITHAVIAGTAQAVLSKSPNERTSVLSTATRCLTLSSLPRHTITSSTTFRSACAASARPAPWARPTPRQCVSEAQSAACADRSALRWVPLPVGTSCRATGTSCPCFPHRPRLTDRAPGRAKLFEQRQHQPRPIPTRCATAAPSQPRALRGPQWCGHPNPRKACAWKARATSLPKVRQSRASGARIAVRGNRSRFLFSSMRR